MTIPPTQKISLVHALVDLAEQNWHAFLGVAKDQGMLADDKQLEKWLEKLREEADNPGGCCG